MKISGPVERPGPLSQSDTIEGPRSSSFRSCTPSQSLAGQNAKARIDIRIRRISLGTFGDVKAVGEGVRELRVDCGPGYRVYFAQRGDVLVILLCGGDKRTQAKDITRAREMAADL